MFQLTHPVEFKHGVFLHIHEAKILSLFKLAILAFELLGTICALQVVYMTILYVLKLFGFLIKGNTNPLPPFFGGSIANDSFLLASFGFYTEGYHIS